MIIAHIISAIGGGGRERRMGQLVIDLNSINYAEQHVVYFSKSADEYPEISNSGAKLHLIEYKNKAQLIYNLYKVINNIKPQIVHTWNENPIILFEISALKSILRYNFIVGFLADGNLIHDWRTSLAIKYAYYNANMIISNSYAGLIAKGAKDFTKSKVIYNGFDYKRLKRSNLEQTDVIKESNSKYYISMVARFSKAKNWDMFISVAEEIIKKRDNIIFLAIGSGVLLDYYKNKAKEKQLTNIVFLGRRTDVEILLNKSNISILFTNNDVHAEGVSNSILESMAVGCPVIATAGGGTAEIIQDGVNGYIVQPNDVNSAIQHIYDIIDNPQKASSLSQEAKRTIREHFLLADKTQEYIEVYDSLKIYR